MERRPSGARLFPRWNRSTMRTNSPSTKRTNARRDSVVGAHLWTLRPGSLFLGFFAALPDRFLGAYRQSGQLISGGNRGACWEPHAHHASTSALNKSAAVAIMTLAEPFSTFYNMILTRPTTVRQRSIVGLAGGAGNPATLFCASRTRRKIPPLKGRATAKIHFHDPNEQLSWAKSGLQP